MTKEHEAKKVVDMYEVPKSQAVVCSKTPKHTLLVVIRAGIAKGLLLWWQTISLGWHAGMFIAIGTGLTIVILGNMSSFSVSGTDSVGDVALTVTMPSGILKLIGGSIFPIGLVLTVLAGAELFTGNVMYLTAAFMANKIKWYHLAANWILSYFANLGGSLAVAYFLFHKAELLQSDSANPSPAQEYLFYAAEAKTSVGMWWPYFLRGIGCNFLVCMAMWNALACDDVVSKIVALWWPIMGFVSIGFEHCVANMFYVPMAIMEGYDLSARQFIARNLIPVTLGNIVGGVMFIAVQYLVYHPYIEHDLNSMWLKQGGKKHLKRTDGEHEVLEHEDTAVDFSRPYQQLFKKKKQNNDTNKVTALDSDTPDDVGVELEEVSTKSV